MSQQTPMTPRNRIAHVLVAYRLTMIVVAALALELIAWGVVR
jgi:hypothetical protein